MTVHWTDKDFKRKSAALACRRFSGTHSYDRVAVLISEIHSSFGLSPSKITATVTDNASNFVKAFKEFGVDVSNVDIHYVQPAASEEIDDGRSSAGTPSLSGAGEDEDRDTVSDSGETDVEESESESEGENEEADEATEDIEDPVELEPWLPFDQNDALNLPSHARCMAHTLALCATTDVRRIMDANPQLAAFHNSVLTKCNALWRRSRFPKSAEIIKTVTGTLGERISAIEINRRVLLH